MLPNGSAHLRQSHAREDASTQAGGRSYYAKRPAGAGRGKFQGIPSNAQHQTRFAMPLNYDKLMSTKFEPVRQTYARRDTMLYALGVGVGALDPCDPQELKYVYEKNLVALPTLAVTLAAGAMRLSDPAYGLRYRMLVP